MEQPNLSSNPARAVRGAGRVAPAVVLLAAMVGACLYLAGCNRENAEPEPEMHDVAEGESAAHDVADDDEVTPGGVHDELLKEIAAAVSQHPEADDLKALYRTWMHGTSGWERAVKLGRSIESDMILHNGAGVFPLDLVDLVFLSDAEQERLKVNAAERFGWQLRHTDARFQTALQLTEYDTLMLPDWDGQDAPLMSVFRVFRLVYGRAIAHWAMGDVAEAQDAALLMVRLARVYLGPNIGVMGMFRVSFERMARDAMLTATSDAHETAEAVLNEAIAAPTHTLSLRDVLVGTLALQVFDAREHMVSENPEATFAGWTSPDFAANIRLLVQALEEYDAGTREGGSSVGLERVGNLLLTKQRPDPLQLVNFLRSTLLEYALHVVHGHQALRVRLLNIQHREREDWREAVEAALADEPDLSVRWSERGAHLNLRRSHPLVLMTTELDGPDVLRYLEIRVPELRTEDLEAIPADE
jgi:hypothetical protein